jgi:hypothetical protein
VPPGRCLGKAFSAATASWCDAVYIDLNRPWQGKSDRKMQISFRSTKTPLSG